MGQRLIISEEDRSRINKMYGLNEQSSTSGYKWSKPQTSATVCIKWVEIGGKRVCKKSKRVRTIYLDPVPIETQEFPQLSKLMNHFILNPNSMKENFENIFSKIDFDFDVSIFSNLEKIYKNLNRFKGFIEDEVKKMNVELNKDKEKPNLKPEEYNFGNYRHVLDVMNAGLKDLVMKGGL